MSAERTIKATVELAAAVREKPGLTSGALEYLLAEASKTVEWENYVTCNDALDVDKLHAAVKRSDVGQMVYGTPAQKAPVTIDHAAATAGMRTAEKMAYARRFKLIAEKLS